MEAADGEVKGYVSDSKGLGSPYNIPGNPTNSLLFTVQFPGDPATYPIAALRTATGYRGKANNHAKGVGKDNEETWTATDLPLKDRSKFRKRFKSSTTPKAPKTAAASTKNKKAAAPTGAKKSASSKVAKKSGASKK
jgi:hypothetical protein